MNKKLMLGMLLEEAERQVRQSPLKKEQRPKDILEERFLPGGRERQLSKTLEHLNNRTPVDLPPILPKNPDGMLGLLRGHFKDKVTLISFVLSEYYPDKYFFYRVASLEQEIFDGLEFFADIVPEFELGFQKVGRTGMDRYLRLNQALLIFAQRYWPNPQESQTRMMQFLYNGLGKLFQEKSEYNRYWAMSAKPDYWWELDEKKETVWSGRKEMHAGDLAFMYRTAPRKAITDLYRVTGEPYFDPWGSWNGFWAKIVKIEIPDIKFSDMRNDPILSQWSTIQKSFQGTVTDPVPHRFYNRLLELIPEATRQQHNLAPEPLPAAGMSGEFTLEAEFEEKVIEPLLKRWDFDYHQQRPCIFRVGSQRQHTRIDFLVRDGRGPLTLFEDKLRILNDKERDAAAEQAKSYALMLGLSSFVVASPEGMWVYSLKRNQERLERYYNLTAAPDQNAEIRDLLLRLRLTS